MSPEARAWLCANLAPLRKAADRHGLTHDVEALVASVQADPDGPADDELRALSRSVGGPAVVVRGIGGLPSGEVLGARMPGVGGGLPARVAYCCPSLGCGRQAARTPGGPQPWCAVSEGPMAMTTVAP
ncbi:hypothetical protein [Streptomyces sp. NBC_00829]|uniref:hypothetical protein n=1 Tax=Streptomyces sp. NBC_00829 TaxID=2903679 RepID=UPI0038685DCB|nr:hypothetical protein OG293_35490 [Streptomyces sp. NBC_00829]